MLNKIKNFLNFSKRTDNWTNTMTNLGVQSSRVNNTNVGSFPILGQSTLEEMYKSNGLCQKIINIIVDDAMKNFIEADYDLLQEMARFKLKQVLTDGCYYGRLYGGALLVAFIDDGLELDKPVDLKRIDKLISVRVFDRFQVYWSQNDLNNDYGSENFGKPEFYNITSYSNLATNDLGYIKVHRSRCFVVNGAPTTNRIKLFNNGWDTSVLQSCFNSLRNYGIVTDSSAEIVQDFVQVIFKMNGLAQKMSEQGGEEKIRRRMNYIDISRSIANSIFIDSDSEDYNKSASSVAGLADLWDRFSEVICSVTGYPATKLFGRSAGGLNSTGEHDLKNYYDNVTAYREDQLQPAIDWVIEFLKNQKTWKKKPNTFEWQFKSLISPSELELAKIKREYAEIDWGYIDRGAINAAEAWQERFGQEKFNYNIKLSEVKNLELDKEDENLLLDIKKDMEEEYKNNEESVKTKEILENLYSKLVK